MTATLAAAVVGIAVVGMAVTTLINLIWFPRLRRTKTEECPSVSVLIPARDEAKDIGETVSALLSQEYPDFELIVLDDQSTDGTADVALDAAGANPRFRLVVGEPVPDGWLGKNWACHRLAAAARGDVLVFADADVRWEAGALAAVVDEAGRADLLSVWPTQHTKTWAERLVVPNMALAILAYLPIPAVHLTTWRPFAAANGQCMVFRRDAYDAVGGHAAVRDRVVEDVALARRIRERTLRLRMADGNGLVRCRMYDGWAAVRDGFAKNILAGHGDSIALLGASTVFHWMVFVWPWLWLAASGSPAAVVLATGGVLIRMATAVFTRQRAVDAALMPVTVVLMTAIAARSVRWRLRGGGRWKGRELRGRA